MRSTQECSPQSAQTKDLYLQSKMCVTKPKLKQQMVAGSQHWLGEADSMIKGTEHCTIIHHYKTPLAHSFTRLHVIFFFFPHVHPALSLFPLVTVYTFSHHWLARHWGEYTSTAAMSFQSCNVISKPQCHFKTINESAKLETFKTFCLLFLLRHMKGLKAEVL